MRRPFALLFCTLFLLAGCGDQNSHNANLILITLDTQRADFLGSAGYPEVVSPHLDRLAERSLLFENAYATAPFTGPSHASILTGQHTSTHGVIYNGHRARSLAIGAKSVTLAEHLGQAGFNTKAVVSGGPLDARFGFGRGFEGYNLVPQMGYPDSGGDPAQVTRRAGNWLLDWKHTGQQERFFLWVHYFVPHLPYLNRPAGRDSLGIAFAQTVDEANVATLPVQDVRQAYRAEVFEMDRFIGELLAKLEKLELADDTIIAVVGDHGEYLQEHGLTNHHRLYDEVLHVPMFIHWRDLKAVERRGAAVSTVDLVPTLLELLGVAEMPTAQGRSLRRAAASEPVFAEWRDFRLLGDHDPRPGDFLVSVQDGQQKLIRDLLFPTSSLCFDLAVDPNETNNLYGEDHPLTNELGALLDGHLKNGLPHGLAGIDDIQIDEKSLEMLRSLGYVR